MSAAAPHEPPVSARSSRRRLAWWAALIGLLAIAQSLLVWLTMNFEASRAQERVDAVATSVAAELRHRLSADARRVDGLANAAIADADWRSDVTTLMLSQRELTRIERRDPALRITAAVDSSLREPLFSALARDQLDFETDAACAAARRAHAPVYSQSYFVPLPGGLGGEVIDVCTPVTTGDRAEGFVVATVTLASLLDSVESPELARNHELSFVEGDGTRLARSGPTRGAGVFVADRVVDAPGHSLQLHVDSVAGRPDLIPNLATGLVLGLSMLLFGVVIVLARDVRKRARAESALAESLAFRKAMENSVVTGLRACDMAGRITYVNNALCDMVGFEAAELIGQSEDLYWPADRQGTRRPPGAEAMAAPGEGGGSPGHEATFVRKSGERFPVMVFEATLLDGSGQQTGWMGTVLDLSAQRKVEEVSRQQQERLQATARLATIGEMASLLSHELNQPLSAIASYATGSINLMAEAPPDSEGRELLTQAMQRIAEQAERAGRIIKSVHDFVRRREHVREAIRTDRLIDSILPLVRLQARRSGARIQVRIDTPAPSVLCDRTMVEQVLLNLTRNGIQAMDGEQPVRDPELTIEVRQHGPRQVSVSVADNGPGVAEAVAAQLFTPFFTTRAEGMGLGLNLCRTVIEQHGGALDFENLHDASGAPAGARFRFTLPSAPARVSP